MTAKKTAAVVKPAAKPVAKPATTVRAAAAATVVTATTSPVEQLAELTQHRGHLAELRDLTANAPRSLTEASAAVAEVVEQLAASVEVPAGWLGQAGGVGELVHLLTRTDQQEYRPLTAAQLFSWAAPDLLAQALHRELALAYEPRSLAEASADVEDVVAQLAANVELPVSWLGNGPRGAVELAFMLSRTDEDYKFKYARCEVSINRGFSGYQLRWKREEGVESQISPEPTPPRTLQRVFALVHD